MNIEDFKLPEGSEFLPQSIYNELLAIKAYIFCYLSTTLSQEQKDEFNSLLAKLKSEMGQNLSGLN